MGDMSDQDWSQLDWSSMTDMDMNDSLMSPDVMFMLPSQGPRPPSRNQASMDMQDLRDENNWENNKISRAKQDNAQNAGFTALTKFFSGNPDEFSSFLEERSFRELCEILDLSKQYLVDPLVDKITSMACEKDITPDIIMEVAKVAKDYHHLGEVSHQLLQRSSNSLAGQITDLSGLRQFVAQVGDEDGQLFVKMVGMIQDEYVPLSACVTCQMNRI